MYLFEWVDGIALELS